MMLKLIISNSGTTQDASDIYQETIIAFYEKSQSLDFVLTCKIKTYLYAIGRRLWLKRLSQKKILVRHINDEGIVSGIEETMEEVQRKEKEFLAMEDSLKLIGEPCRAILEGFYLRSETMEDIRERFGYTNTENAKNQKYKCLQRLKKLFFESKTERP